MKFNLRKLFRRGEKLDSEHTPNLSTQQDTSKDQQQYSDDVSKDFLEVLLSKVTTERDRQEFLDNLPDNHLIKQLLDDDKPADFSSILRNLERQTYSAPNFDSHRPTTNLRQESDRAMLSSPPRRR